VHHVMHALHLPGWTVLSCELLPVNLCSTAQVGYAHKHLLLLRRGLLFPRRQLSASLDDSNPCNCVVLAAALLTGVPCMSHGAPMHAVAWQLSCADLKASHGPEITLACALLKGSRMHFRTTLGTSVRGLRISAQPAKFTCTGTSPMLT
jgi:hypothetical protein